jgi:hypothetical protein
MYLPKLLHTGLPVPVAAVTTQCFLRLLLMPLLLLLVPAVCCCVCAYPLPLPLHPLTADPQGPTP